MIFWNLNSVFLKTIYRSLFPGTEVSISITGILDCSTLILKHVVNLYHTYVARVWMFKAASLDTTTAMQKAGLNEYETAWMQ